MVEEPSMPLLTSTTKESTNTTAANGTTSTLTTHPLPSSLLTVEQELLFPYICNNLKSCYNRSVKLLMASLALNDKHRKSVHNYHQNQRQPQNPQYEISQAKEEAKSRHIELATSLVSAWFIDLISTFFHQSLCILFEFTLAIRTTLLARVR